MPSLKAVPSQSFATVDNHNASKKIDSHLGLPKGLFAIVLKPPELFMLSMAFALHA